MNLPASILKYPYPYKAWLAMANDPDNTLMKDWEELHQTIWQELGIPFGDSLFIKSFNHNLAGQVSLSDYPKIATAHHHDTIHTWGDYMYSRSKGFDREDAIEGIKILQQHDISPQVWIDHSGFEGNLLHRNGTGAIPNTTDKSGHTYQNYVYTFDLIRKIGIFYIWDGKLTQVIGQDRKLPPLEYFNNFSTSKVKALLKYLFFLSGLNRWLSAKIKLPKNHQYTLHEFTDGQTAYCFQRYGTWEAADIYGLGEIIAPEKVDKLIQREGTSIVYTHLGKRPANKMDEVKHIPNTTLRAFKYLKSCYDQKKIMLSPVSKMLDYLVLRDHIEVDISTNEIRFNPDGIRFQNIDAMILKGTVFSFRSDSLEPPQVLLTSKGKQLSGYRVEVVPNENIFSVFFE